MDTRKIVQNSVDILVKYYENNIKPFESAMDDDILWIGPLQGQMIRGKKNLVNTYTMEEHDLTFDVFDMQASVVYSTKQHCEVLLTFIVIHITRISQSSAAISESYYPGSIILNIQNPANGSAMI